MTRASSQSVLAATARTEAELDDLLSAPPPALAQDLAELPGDILVLGVGGKMGPTLARMARRAADEADGGRGGRRILGVSRFSTPGLAAQLEEWGVEAIGCDLLDRQAVAALPDAPNVVFMAGRKFGSTGGEA